MSERRVRRRKPRLKFDKQMYKKLGILFWIVVLALFALCTRIAYLNVAKGDNYSIKVLEQQSFTSKTIPYKRGDIKDRNGNVLATSVMVYNLIIDSKVVMSNEKYLTPTVNALVKYFDFNEDASACASAIIWLDFCSALAVACFIISLPSSFAKLTFSSYSFLKAIPSFLAFAPAAKSS